MSKDEILSLIGYFLAFVLIFLLLKFWIKYTKREDKKGYQEWPTLKWYGIFLLSAGIANATKEILTAYVFTTVASSIMDFIYVLIIGLFVAFSVVILVARLIASATKSKVSTERGYKNIPFYFEKDNKLKMRGSCSTFNKALNIIATSMCTLLAAASAYLVVRGNNDINLFLYCYAIMFVQLLANFFDGEVDIDTKKENSKGTSASIGDSVWKNLEEEYSSLWKDKMLGSYAIKKEIKDDQEDEPVSLQDMMCQIISGKNIVIDNLLITQFNDLLLAIVNILFSSQKKILFLCDDLETVNKCTKWLNDLSLNKDLATRVIKTLSYEDVNNQLGITPNADILIATTDLILKCKTEVNNVDVIIGINVDKILTHDSIGLSVLCSQLQAKDTSMQYILFSKNVKGIMAAVSQVFMVNNFEFKAIDTSSIDEFVTDFWAADRGWLQTNIIPGFGSSYMGQLLPITIPALKENITDINVISGDNPIDDYNNSLMMSQLMVKGYLGDGKNIADLSKNIHHNDKNNFITLTDRAVVVVDDQDNNAAGCLNDWMKYIKEDMFLNIVSKQYLLRDYIVSNIDYFVGNVQTVSALIPMYHDNIKSFTYKIINELCDSGIYEERLKTILIQNGFIKISDMSKINQGVIEDALTKLAANSLGSKVEFGSYMKLDTVKSGVSVKNIYNLVSNIKNELPKKYFQSIKFIDVEKNAKVLKQVPYFELYQNYVEGKKVNFDGKSYIIKDINYDHGTVQLLANNTLENYVYRDKKYVKLFGDLMPKSNYMNQNVSNTNIKIDIYEGNVDIKTLGYIESINKLNLQPGYFNENNLEGKINDYARQYYRNDVMKFTIKNRVTMNNSKEMNDKIAFMLSFMLNEMFKTFLPDLNQYMIARAITDQERAPESKIEEIYYPIAYSTLYDEQAVSLFLLEDTDLPKGIVETVISNIRDILYVVIDYLNWIEEPDIKHTWVNTQVGDDLLVSEIDKLDFLKLGGDRVDMDTINGLRELLDDLSLQNQLTKFRREFINSRQEKINENVSNDKKQTNENKTKKDVVEFVQIDETCPICGNKLFLNKTTNVKHCNTCNQDIEFR